MGSIMALHDLDRIEEFESRFARFRDGIDGNEGVARIYAWIGDNDKAFAWLDKMIETDGSEMVRLINTDLYAKIKTDPRWQKMRSAHGFDDSAIETVDFTYSLPHGAAIN